MRYPEIGTTREMFYSPLRYPCIKGKFAPLMKVLTEKTVHVDGTYIGPFAGGAETALILLENEAVSLIGKPTLWSFSVCAFLRRPYPPRLAVI